MKQLNMLLCGFLSTLLITHVLSEPCEPMEEGKEAFITCQEVCNDGSWTVVRWQAGSNTIGDCKQDNSDVQPNREWFSIGCDDIGGKTYASALRIKQVSRRITPFDMLNEQISCLFCEFKRSSTICDRLEIYSKPEDVSLTLAADQRDDNGALTGITLTCVSGRSFPSAFCKFFHVRDVNFTRPLDMQVTHEVDMVSGSSDVDAYYRSQITGVVSIDSLGPGTHSFYAQVYPDVTDGERFFTQTDNTNSITLSPSPNIDFFGESINEVKAIYDVGDTPTLRCRVSDTGLQTGFTVAITDTNTELATSGDGDDEAVYTVQPLTCTGSSEVQQYTCIAANQFGRDQETLEIPVKCNLELVLPEIQDKVFYANSADDVEASVSFSGYPHPHSFVLSRGSGTSSSPLQETVDYSMEIQAEGQDWTATIGFNDISWAHFDSYTLQLSHLYGPPLTWRFSIVSLGLIREPGCNETAPLIDDLTSIHAVDGSMTVQCIASGLPTPNVYLYKDSESLATERGDASMPQTTLRYTQQELTCTGGVETYLCVAENFMGKTERDINLAAECPLRMEEVNYRSVFNAELSGNLTASFLVLGYPEPSSIILRVTSTTAEINQNRYEVQSFTDEATPSRHLITLTMFAMEKEDFTDYTLDVENGVGIPLLISFSSEQVKLFNPETPPNITVFYTSDSGNAVKTTFAVGEEIMFHCEAEGHPTPTTALTRQATGSMMHHSDTQVLDYRGYTAVCSGVAEVFECRAVNSVGFSQMTTAVWIHCPLEIANADFRNNFYSILGGNLLVSFSLSGFPEPFDFTLQSSGQTVGQNRYVISAYSNEATPSIHIVRLEMFSMKKSDFTQYTLRVANAAGGEDIDFNAVEIEIPASEGPPVITQFRAFGDDNDVRSVFVEKENVKLRCEVQGNPQASISLERPSTGNVLKGITGDTLEYEVNNLQCTGETEAFRCVAENSFGTTEEIATIEIHCPLEIQQPEAHVVLNPSINEDVSLSLVVIGYPGPTTYTLTKGTTSSTVNSGRYDGNSYTDDQVKTEHLVKVSLRSFQTDDFGTYRLSLGNGVGDDVTWSFSLVDSEADLNITDFSSFLDQTEQSTFLEGATATLRCITNANPAADMTLRRQSPGGAEDELVTGNGNILQYSLENINCTGIPQDFVCEAENPAGLDQKSARIYVQCPLTELSHQQNTLYAKAGRTVSISYSVFGYPEPSTIELLKGAERSAVMEDAYEINVYTRSSFVQGRAELQISLEFRSVNQADFAKYFLRVGNEVGNAVEWEFRLVEAVFVESVCQNGTVQEDSTSDKVEMGVPVVAGVAGAFLLIIVFFVVLILVFYWKSWNQNKETIYEDTYDHINGTTVPPPPPPHRGSSHGDIVQFPVNPRRSSSSTNMTPIPSSADNSDASRHREDRNVRQITLNDNSFQPEQPLAGPAGYDFVHPVNQPHIYGENRDGQGPPRPHTGDHSIHDPRFNGYLTVIPTDNYHPHF